MTTIQKKKYISTLQLDKEEYEEIQKQYRKYRQKLQRMGITTFKGLVLLSVFDTFKKLEAEE